MIDVDVEYAPLIEILDNILGEPKSHNTYKFQISYDCPVCSYEIKGLDQTDGKGNFEVNYRFGVYKCWSCGDTHETHGSIEKLIKKFGNAKHLKRYEIVKPESYFIPDSEEKRTTVVKLPKEYVHLHTASDGIKRTHFYKEAKNYLNARNITDDMIKRYSIGFCYQGYYANRIIIPSYDEDYKLNYFIARSYESKTKFKYRNPEAEKEAIIWNEHLIDWDETVYIVEGVFDSIFLPNSIPMLGKSMSELLFKRLYDNAKKVVIILDGDAWDNAVKLYYKLNGGRLWGKVWVVKLPIDKDIADLQGKLEEYEEIQLT